MEIKALRPAEMTADVVITGFFEDDKTLNDIQKFIDEKFNGS